MVYQHQVNMGNIHFKMGQYNKAIKYYRMALDQVWLRWVNNDYNDDNHGDDDDDHDNDDDDDHLWPLHHDILDITESVLKVPNTHKTMRIKIMHNIGVLFVKMGQSLDDIVVPSILAT